ncbi:hypothetical protein OB236_17885 [Paenibacillus sp. WQ 127069]|uniref:Peptidase M10 metallopeptidase domain-containing protein n=1 Tax=Paenibacillus baimaensis TaxID=2982185 RepID=A0ABT2UJD1_9BACL|nr:matrixin family metalloprotease [Paenibacillus sp. WQ 127069]MCU6793977.1 hypothetical protein [Paenibacillus sp. WQ 127069]
MKKISKSVITTATTILLAATMLSTANAELYAGKRTPGNGNIPYFIHSSVDNYSTNYTNIYTSAASSWNGINSHVSLSRVYETNNSKPDVYGVSTSQRTLQGEMICYDSYSASAPSHPSSNWLYAMTLVYDNNTPNEVAKKSAAVHEIGHTLGLAHTFQPNETSVMSEGNFFTAPRDYDKAQLNLKWP